MVTTVGSPRPYSYKLVPANHIIRSFSMGSGAHAGAFRNPGDCHTMTICGPRRCWHPCLVVSLNGCWRLPCRLWLCGSEERVRNRCLPLVLVVRDRSLRDQVERTPVGIKGPAGANKPQNFSCPAMQLSFFITFPRFLSPCCAPAQNAPRYHRLAMLTVSCQGILDHMDESGVYNESDLAPFHRRLAELR